MTDRNKHIALGMFIIIFTLGYYAWIGLWKNSPDLSAMGGSFFSGAGNLIAVIWLTGAARKSSRERKSFWIFLSLGTFSYLAAETLWLYDEAVLGISPPSPGWTDVFFILQIVFYLAAFIYPFTRLERNYRALRLLFDVLIVMTVATTFSWHFLIDPLLSTGDADMLHLAVSLVYPVGDLALLLGAVSLYWGARQIFADKLVLLVVGGLVVHAAANSVYLYLVSHDAYTMGNLVDPLFTLSLLLIGGAGALEQRRLTAEAAPRVPENLIKRNRKTELVRVAFPYMNVIILFLFMVADSGRIDPLMIGCGISILLVIARQVFILLENRRLLQNLYEKTQELEISEQRYRSLFDYHPDAVYSLDLDGNFDSANGACAEILGYTGEELRGMSYTDFIDDPSSAGIWGEAKQRREGQSRRHEVTIRDRAGQLYEVSITSIPIWVGSRVVGLFGIGRDITENKRNEAKISRLAYHDPLTDLANRTSFDEALKQALTEADSEHKELAVVFIDLDRFKSVNDTLGHDVGDKLLVSVADRLRSCMRKGDRIARQGGDEFTLLFQDILGIDDVKNRARRILDELSLPHDIDGRKVPGTPSMGIARYPADDTTAVGLMKKADIALYQVKDGGKGHYRLFGDSASWVFDKLVLEQDLAEALSNDALSLHYEPQFNPDTQVLTGVEARIRWNRPGYGLLEPDRFMSAAAEIGLMPAIGEWMLHEACRQSRSWQDQGTPVKTTLNLSSPQLEQDNLPELLKHCLDESGADPELLELELPEASFLRNPQHLLPRLHALKRLGISLSVDGCGAPYAMISGLQDLPVDTLKVDPDLIRHIGSSRVAQAIVASVADIGRALQIRVAAEGVENEDQVSILRGFARFGMQGPLFGRAVPPDEPGSLPQPVPGL
ncbi:putative bifunctional diguanylate cyclase/phosphodiesterase [Saccharibacillus deserti]|uniref:putative bifunctional diguanylate cyclase/phosphodiesterase n=1 Tax=Saccharibacillus deserti TaxID=1634444 RepID=UPI001FE4F02C|nr:DUF4084 domain-containing protein [Saccharibacillus deserti]